MPEEVIRYGIDFACKFKSKNYEDWIRAMQNKNCRFMTCREALQNSFEEDVPNVIIRHDVDFKPNSAEQFYNAEKELGIRSSFYILSNYKANFDINRFKVYENDGFEVGYHLDTNDYDIAVKNINLLRNDFDIKTYVAHSGNNAYKSFEQYDVKKFLDNKFAINIDGYIADNGAVFRKLVGYTENEEPVFEKEDIYNFINNMESGKVYHISIHTDWYINCVYLGI